MQDIRWQQRFQNFQRAFGLLREAMDQDLKQLNQLEKEGIIQRFEFTFELAWKVLKDKMEHDGLVIDQISPQQFAVLLGTLKQFPDIESAIIFGSRAKGTMYERSDIDLAITGKSLDRHRLAELILAFDESDLPYQVDIQLLSDIQNPTLLEHISRVGKVIYP